MYHTETLCALAHPTPFPQRACHVLPPPRPPPYRMQRPMHEYQLRKTIDAVLWG